MRPVSVTRSAPSSAALTATAADRSVSELVELPASEERALRDQIDSLAVDEAKCEHAVDLAQDNFATSKAAYEALLETDEVSRIIILLNDTAQTDAALKRVQAIIAPAAFGGTILSFRVFRQRLPTEEPKKFGFLRQQGISLETDRLAKIEKIHIRCRPTRCCSMPTGTRSVCSAACVNAASTTT